jgi:phosphinothricin acetyltransferase
MYNQGTTHVANEIFNQTKAGIPMGTITVRDATPGDAERILEIYAYYVENTAITFEYTVPTLAEFQERMTCTMKKYPYIVIEKDGVIEGYAYASAFVGRAAYDWSCEMTVYLDQKVRSWKIDI